MARSVLELWSPDGQTVNYNVWETIDRELSGLEDQCSKLAWGFRI
jgi:hypothetical protein